MLFLICSLQSSLGCGQPVLPCHVHQPLGRVSAHRDPPGGGDAFGHGDGYPVRVHGGSGALPRHGRGLVCGSQPSSSHALAESLFKVTDERTSPVLPLLDERNRCLFFQKSE